jgi:hypothetical protein
MALSKRKTALEDRLAIVLLENVWWKLSDNPGMASSEPFFQGLCRHDDNAQCYRLPFYDKASLKESITFARNAPHKRVLLHIGAHGENGRIGGVTTRDLAASLKAIGPTRHRAIEGVILSSCSIGANTLAIKAAFQSGARWVFAYKQKVDWMGSVLIDISIAEEVSLEPDDSYTSSEERIAKSLGEGLKKFNPSWSVDEDSKGTSAALSKSIALWAKPKGKRIPKDITARLADAAWGSMLR